MAKFTAGAIVGQVSGRLAGTIFSHNKGGPYMRNGTIPTVVTSDAAVNAKARLAQLSVNWRGLTDDQRNAWTTYAQTNPVIDRLGKQITLSGHQAYNGINTRLNLWGQTLLDDPPVVAAPDPLTSITLSADIGAGDVQLAYTPTPAGAGIAVEVWAAVADSAGINYVRNLYRYITVTAAAAASPVALEAALIARFGTLQVGQKVFVQARTGVLAAGVVSGWRQDTATVVST